MYVPKHRSLTRRRPTLTPPARTLPVAAVSVVSLAMAAVLGPAAYGDTGSHFDTGHGAHQGKPTRPTKPHQPHQSGQPGKPGKPDQPGKPVPADVTADAGDAIEGNNGSDPPATNGGQT